MKYGISATVLAILIHLFSLSLDTAEAAAVDPAKPQINLSLMQRYNIHAQCSRLAYWAGYYKLMGEHMAAAKELKPKSVPDSDISYRTGFVDGQLSGLRNNGPKLTFKRLAREGYTKICPTKA